MNTPQHTSRREQSLAMLGILVFLARTLAVSVEVFLHTGFGSRYLGIQAAAVFVVAPICMSLSARRPSDATALVWFLLAYLAMCVALRVQRVIGAVRARRAGEGDVGGVGGVGGVLVPIEHTHYSGWPRLMRFAGPCSELAVKGTIEPLLVFTAGALLLPLSQALGGYLMLAAFSLLLKTRLSITHSRTRVMDMHDAFLEQQRLAEDFRAMRGE